MQFLFNNAAESKAAVFSDCKLYRYSLSRIWNTDKPLVAFIGLNPSTADAENDDPTIRRCVNFAKAWGMGGLYMLNLFALRATHPKDMRSYPNPIGAENNHYLIETCKLVDKVVFAWGYDGTFLERNKEVIALFPNAYCLGKTKCGQPRHPLYLKKDTLLRLF